MRFGLQAASAGCALLYLSLIAGCRTTSSVAQIESEPRAALASLEAQAPAAGIGPGVALSEGVQPVAHQQPIAEVIPSAASDVLDVDAFVAEVLAVNPDVRAASAAWRAAAQRYPQVVALDDPMFGYMLGPGSWGRDDVRDAYVLEASQSLPWSGKRRLRGDIARAEANAAYFEVGEERLRIAETARLAYYEYFLAHRQLAVLAESTDLLRDFRQIALSRYESASVEQQDVLLADVELADLKRRQLELDRNERVARARINTLLLAPADAPLPPPPNELAITDSRLASTDLRALALSQRPELAAQEARIRREQYAVRLAYKEFYPDFEVVGRYDAFWQEDPLRPMVGMNLNVPIGQKKRWAAVNEARSNVARQNAELEGKINELMFEVERASQLVDEGRGALLVYHDSILPTVRHSVEAARASYIAGRLDFLRLIASQRQLLEMQDRYFEAMAEYRRREASLRRLIGEPPNAVIDVGPDSFASEPDLEEALP